MRLNLVSALTVWCLLLARVVSAQAVDSDPINSTEFLKWALTQGGGYVAALVLGFFYRRDMAKIMTEKDAQIATLTRVVEAGNARNADVAAALTGLSERRYRGKGDA